MTTNDGRNLLTHSRISCYKTCTHKHHLQYTLGVRPAIEATPLRYGSNVHDGLDLLAQGVTIEQVTDIIRERYEDRPTWADATDWQVECEQIVCLLTAYVWYYSDDELEVVETEQSFVVPITNPVTWKASRSFRRAGKTDKLVHDVSPSGNRIYGVLEHKTTGDSVAPGSDYWTKARFSEQPIGYFVAERIKRNGVAVVIYDAIHKPGMGLLRATPIEKRKFKADGSPYKSTRLKDETVADYSARLFEDITDRPQFYFQRQRFYYTEADVRRYETDLWAVQKQIRFSETQDLHPRNTSACTVPYRCQYIDVCNDDITADNIPEGFTQVTNVHQELTNASNEAAPTNESAAACERQTFTCSSGRSITI